MHIITATVFLGTALLLHEDPTRKALQADADTAFYALLVMSGIVLIGVVFEFFDVCHEFQHWRRSDVKDSWRPVFSLIGLILVTIGLSGEVIFEGRLGNLDTDLRNFDKMSIVDNEIKVAQANERTANAEKATEDEKLERLKMEASIAPRRMTSEQERHLMDGCRAPYKEPIIIKSYAGDAESVILGDQIAKSLQIAGIKIDRQVGAVGMSRPIMGINISGPKEETGFMRCVARGLRDLGNLDAVVNGPRFQVELQSKDGGLSTTYEDKPFPSGPLVKGSQIVIAIGIKPVGQELN